MLRFYNTVSSLMSLQMTGRLGNHFRGTLARIIKLYICEFSKFLSEHVYIRNFLNFQILGFSKIFEKLASLFWYVQLTTSRMYLCDFNRNQVPSERTAAHNPSAYISNNVFTVYIRTDLFTAVCRLHPVCTLQKQIKNTKCMPYDALWFWESPCKA